MFKKILLPLIIFASANISFGVGQIETIREYRRSHELEILLEFVSLLSIPNIASDHQNIRRNADFILEMMRRRGLNPQLLEARTPNAPPGVYGEWKSANATRTIVLYAHYDGQPADP